jgi:hypothetical protein
MPQAAIANFFLALGASAGTAAVAAAITQTILINIALGATEFEDEDGNVWRAA